MRVFRNKKNKEKEVIEETKSVCRVIVATPSYFVINKDGETITIKKKNTYHKGEEIYY